MGAAMRLGVAMSILAAATTLGACAHPAARGAASAEALEHIYILRSIREQQIATPGWCDASRTGFEPFPTEAERAFSFWSVQSRAQDGKVVDAMRGRVAQLRACFGPTSEPARQNFHAEIQLGELSFRGRGECMALLLDIPESGLNAVRCHLVLRDLPDTFVGGLLTTSTLTSRAGFGGDTDPPGYSQASIATIRLWRAPQPKHGDSR